MRMLDEHNRELSAPDPEQGWLKEERLLIAHHPAVEAAEEQGHYETVAEYPNGGKDVAWVVDVPGTEGTEAWDEYEDIQRYIPYTEAELAQRRVKALKRRLSETDYIAAKLAEGAATREEYADLIAQRQAWREEINALEEPEVAE